MKFSCWAFSKDYVLISPASSHIAWAFIALLSINWFGLYLILRWLLSNLYFWYSVITSWYYLMFNDLSNFYASFSALTPWIPFLFEFIRALRVAFWVLSRIIELFLWILIFSLVFESSLMWESFRSIYFFQGDFIL